MTVTQKGTREAAAVAKDEEFQNLTTKASQTVKKNSRKTLLRIARSAREMSQTGSANPTNLPRETRTRKMRSKKKILVPLKPQQETTPPSKNTRKDMSLDGKKTAKIPEPRMKNY